MQNGLTLLTNIVWSKTIDNTSSGTEGNTGPPNPFDLRSGRGPADFDQAIRYNLSVELHHTARERVGYQGCAGQ